MQTILQLVYFVSVCVNLTENTWFSFDTFMYLFFSLLSIVQAMPGS